MKKEVAFVILTFLITWTCWLLNYFCVSGDLKINEKVFHILGIFGPFFSSLFVSWKYGGEKALVNLLKKGLKFRVKYYWYLITFIAFPLISIVSLWVQNSFQAEKINLSVFNNVKDLVVLFIIMLLFAPIGEEFGWRGFLLDNFQKIWSPFKSAIITGFIWGIWHLPLLFIPGKVLHDFFLFSKTTLFLFPLYTVGLSVIYTWIFNKTKGSVFIVILLHCMTNWSFETFYPSSTFAGFNITYLIIGFFAAGIIIFEFKNWNRIIIKE